MSGAVSIVNARRKLLGIREERLAIRKELCVRLRCNHPVQIVVRYHFNQLIAAVRKVGQYGMNVVAAVRPAWLVT